MKGKFNQLCVWPGTVVGDSKKVQEDFVKFFKDELGVTVKYETEVKTLPDPGDLGMKTGGRNDLFFYIADNDIGKFAIPRLLIKFLFSSLRSPRIVSFAFKPSFFKIIKAQSGIKLYFI